MKNWYWEDIVLTLIGLFGFGFLTYSYSGKGTPKPQIAIFMCRPDSGAGWGAGQANWSNPGGVYDDKWSNCREHAMVFNRLWGPNCNAVCVRDE